MIDTHCHLTEPRLFQHVDEVLRRADAAGVSKILTIGTGIGDDQNAVRLCEQFSQVRCAIGVHPGHAGDEADDFLRPLTELAKSPSVVALGEMGMDYHYLPVDHDRQRRFFESQLQLAVDTRLPVIIHCREAVDDTLAILRAFPTVRGVFHCFTGTVAESTRILDAGFLLGFTGVVTFKKSDELREVCRRTPADRLLVETDAPWLSPDPMRNQKVNEPAFVMHTARKVATLRGIDLKTLDEISTANARSLFGWPD